MLEQDVVAVPQGVGPNLPPGTVIAGEYLEAYLAIAMRGVGGAYLGHLGILARRRIDATGTSSRR